MIKLCYVEIACVLTAETFNGATWPGNRAAQETLSNEPQLASVAFVKTGRGLSLRKYTIIGQNTGVKLSKVIDHQ